MRRRGVNGIGVDSRRLVDVGHARRRGGRVALPQQVPHHRGRLLAGQGVARAERSPAVAVHGAVGDGPVDRVAVPQAVVDVGEDRVCELRVVAVDVADADEERVHASFGSDGERVASLNERISSSDLVLEEADLSDAKVWAFATRSYQTSNSRTVVYAIEEGR